MKLNEIMILKNDDTGTRLKLLQVDDDTLTKLTRIRGNLFKDDPRLKLARDLPTPEPKIEITPEMLARAEASWLAHCMERQATPIQTGIPETKPLSFEEKIQHDWRFNPGIRKEFITFGSYQAFKRAAKEGRTKVYGRG